MDIQEEILFQIEREANKKGGRQLTNVLTSSQQPHYINSLGLISLLFQEKSILLNSLVSIFHFICIWYISIIHRSISIHFNFVIPFSGKFSFANTSSVTDSRGSTWNQGVQSSFEENSGFSRWLNPSCHHQSIFIPSFSASFAFVPYLPNQSTSTVKTQITIQPV